jgi:hypothetical protein
MGWVIPARGEDYWTDCKTAYEIEAGAAPPGTDEAPAATTSETGDAYFNVNRAKMEAQGVDVDDDGALLEHQAAFCAARQHFHGCG